MGKTGNRTKSSRAGLTFPVGRLTRYLREGQYSKRVSPGAGICAPDGYDAKK